MARPRLHDYPCDLLLTRVASLTQAKIDALQATLADAQATQEAEREADEEYMLRHDAASAGGWASGQAHIDWTKENPQPRHGDAWLTERHAEEDLEAIRETGIAYDAQLFAGCDLTPSARITVQTNLRKLHDDGLISLHGAHARSVSVTDAGWAKVAELAAKEIPTDA